MSKEPNSGLWLSVGVAAEVAGAARRSAYRWASRGLLPVKRVGRRRLVEVGALAAAVSRMTGNRASEALFGATAGEQAVFAPSPAPGAATGALEDALLLLQETVALQEQRLAEIERLLGSSG